MITTKTIDIGPVDVWGATSSYDGEDREPVTYLRLADGTVTRLSFLQTHSLIESLVAALAEADERIEVWRHNRDQLTKRPSLVTA